MQNGESKWTVIANGKSIENGTTIRKNGVVSHFVTSQVESAKKKQAKQQTEQDETVNEENEKDVEKEEDRCHEESPRERKCPSLKVNTFCTKASNEALTTVIQQLRWRESKGNFKSGATADMYWHGPGFEEALYSKDGVYAVNKLPGMVELSQKIHLSRIIKRMQLLFPGEFDFYPPTWFLPEQYHQFVAEVSLKNNRKSSSVTTPGSQFTKQSTPDSRSHRDVLPTYIVKPDCGSQGDGIYLVNDPRDVQEAIGNKPAIVQKYIDDPLLLDNFKFDLRMYVAIARLNPVEIYLCKDGLARLCTAEYESPRPSNLHNTFMHLTNYSINKFSDDFQQTSAGNTGSKRTYRGVTQILRKQGHDVSKIHEQIIDLVTKTVLSLIPDIMIWDHVANKSKLVRSFQILGFDILITSDLRAHLLEVNSSPSMGIEVDQETKPGSGIFESVTSAVDEKIKVPLLRDVLRLIAYGERETDMNKSCLQRIYPPCSKSSDQRTPRQDRPQADEALGQNLQKQKPKDNVRVPTDVTPFRFRKNSTLNKRDSDPVCEETCNKIKVTDLQEPEIQMVERHGVNSQRRFDNPLLRNEATPRPHFAAKKPKRFTVVKYRQEYAISTEEWRLFQLRSKISATSAASRVDIHPVRPFQSRPSPRNLPGVASAIPETSRTPERDEVKADVCCRICGHFVSGVGPGLFHSQQKHKALVEQQEAKIASEKAAFQPLSSPSFASPYPDELERFGDTPTAKHRLYDWESDSKSFHSNALPPRSIYFSSAQHEEEEEKLHSSQKYVTPLPSSHIYEEISKVQLQICDNCMDTSTSSSVHEPMSHVRHRSTPPFQHLQKSKPPAKQLSEQSDKNTKFAMKEIMLVKRAAAIFIFFNGIKPSLRITATAFRNMARRCRLCDQGAMPAIDILFIDTMRQWQRQLSEHKLPFYDSFRCKNPLTAHQPVGLPFQGFLEALFRIAKARFKGDTLREKLETLVSNCEQFIKEANRAKKIARKRQDLQVKQKPVMSPRISCGLSQRLPYY